MIKIVILKIKIINGSETKIQSNEYIFNKYSNLSSVLKTVKMLGMTMHAYYPRAEEAEKYKLMTVQISSR